MNLTNDPFAIGLVGLSEFLPAFSFALYAGHVIDKSEKRKLMLNRRFLLYTGRICCFYCSPLPISPIISASYTIAIGIYAVIFCTGIVRAFTGPTFSAILASVVPRQIFTKCHHLEPGHLAFCICYRPCHRWFSYLATRYHRHTDYCLLFT